MDKEIQELVDVLGASIVPKNRRKSVYRTNWRTPYYSHSRYRKVA